MNKIRFCETGAFRQIAYNNVIHYDVDKDLFDKFKNIYDENKQLKHELESSEHKISNAIDTLETIPNYSFDNIIVKSAIDILKESNYE